MPTSARRPRTRDGLFIVGVIGQAGSGKSTVARVFEREGAAVIDADALAHEIVDFDPQVQAAIAAEYGPEVYGPTGLNRRRVAEVVFRDPAARERLNLLVHPRIVERIRARLEALRKDRFRGTVAIDAALLLDWGFERECDAGVAVTASRAAQLERLRTQRGWDADEAGRVLGAQRPMEVLAGAADVTIENNGGAAELVRVARAALKHLRDGSTD